MKNKKFVKFLRTKKQCPASFNERFLYSLCYRRAVTPADIKAATGWHHDTVAHVSEALVRAGMAEVEGDKVKAVEDRLINWFV